MKRRNYKSPILAALLCLSMLLSSLSPAFAAEPKISDLYRDFILFSWTGRPWDSGWSSYIPDETIENAGTYIYPRTQSVNYHGADAYIGDTLYIRPGSYTLNLTEAGTLSGNRFDTTVSSGSRYTYTPLSGNPSVSKQTVSMPYGSSWTYINLSNLELGDVIRVEAYQRNHLLKVGNPSVWIYRNSEDITGRRIDVLPTDEVDLTAIGFLDDGVSANGPVKFNSGNTSRATVDSSGHVRFLSVGSVTVTASWTSSNGYFTANSSVTFDVEDLSQVTKSISVKDYQPTYHWREEFSHAGTIIAEMADGSVKEVPLSSADSITGFSSQTIGEKTLTVWYGGCKTTFDVTVAYSPASIAVEVQDPGVYGQSKTGKIKLTGDADYVTLPDGTVMQADALRDFLFTENGMYEFTVTGMDGGTDACTVTIFEIDREAPSLTAAFENGVLTITAQDDLSGVRTVEYIDETFEETSPGMWVSSAKTITDSLSGVSPGVYRVIAADHAGNSRSADIEIGGGDGKPVEFSIYVPSGVSMTVNEDGAVTTSPEELNIYNGVVELPICVTGIQVSANGGWELVDFDTEFTDADRDSKKIALSINGSPVSPDGRAPIDREAWVIPADGLLALNLDLKAPVQSKRQVLNNVLKIHFSSDWYDASLIPGDQYAITIEPAEHGTIKGTAATLYTDAYGRVPMLPRVAADEGYDFVKWVRTDTGEAVSIGDVISENITVRPEMNLKADYFIVTFAAGEGGTVRAAPAVVKSGIKLSAIKPAVSVDDGYVFKSWYNEAGSAVKDSYVITKSECLTAKFSKASREISISKTRSALSSLTGTLTFTTAGYTGTGGVDLSIKGDRSVIAVINGQNATVYAAGGAVLTEKEVNSWVSAHDSNAYVDDHIFSAFQAYSMNLGGLDTSGVTTFYGMFYNCKNLTSLDVSTFRTEKVTNMKEMFRGCIKLTTLDLSSFDTGSVVRTDYMFYECSELQSVNLSSFDSGKIGTVDYMFGGCSKLTALDLSSFHFDSLVFMQGTFSGCTSLRTLKFSSKSSDKLEYMAFAFSRCHSLSQLDLRSLTFANVKDVDSIFKMNQSVSMSVYVKNSAIQTRLNNSSNKSSGVSVIVR